MEAKEKREKTKEGLDILRGGTRVLVEYKDPDQEPEEVFVREVTPEDILEGLYVDLLREDYPALLDWVCDMDKGWSRTLTRDSWARLREAEDRINFEYALAETKAAHARGQRLRFIDDAIHENAQKMLKTMGSVASSRNIAGSRGAPAPRPAPNPSAG